MNSQLHSRVIMHLLCNLMVPCASQARSEFGLPYQIWFLEIFMTFGGLQSVAWDYKCKWCAVSELILFGEAK